MAVINTKELMLAAKNGDVPLGQWLDDSFGENFIAQHLNQLANGAIDIPIPPELAKFGRVFENGTGNILVPSHIRLIPSKSGVKSAFPINSAITKLNKIGKYNNG